MSTAVMEPPVFTDKEGKGALWAQYHCRIQMRDKLLGGIPKDPELIEAWIRSSMGIEDKEELRQKMVETLVEQGADVTPDMSYEQLREASKSVASLKQTNGFKLNGHGLYIEDRQIKAMIRESVNILYAGEKWGVTRKGPRNFTAERVFIDPPMINVGRKEPDDVEFMVIHIQDQRGRRSSLAYHELVKGPDTKHPDRPFVTLDFTLKVLRDEIKAEHWPEIWLHAQENGLGAARSQSFGRFDVIEWAPVNGAQPKRRRART